MKGKLKKFWEENKMDILIGVTLTTTATFGGLVGYCVGVMHEAQECDTLYEGLLLNHHEEIFNGIQKALENGEQLDKLKIREILLPWAIAGLIKD